MYGIYIFSYTAHSRYYRRERSFINKQDILRNNTKKLKWEQNISYKILAEDLLDMDYHSFINWIHGRSNLGSMRAGILQDFIDCMS